MRACVGVGVGVGVGVCTPVRRWLHMHIDISAKKIVIDINKLSEPFSR